MRIKRWMKQIICLITIFSLISISFHVYISPSFFSSRAEEVTPTITIENVQSYPKVGGEWRVSFSVKGTADLIITTVEGTTWNTQSDTNYDLIFQHIKNSTKTFNTIWKNNSVIIKNFSSSTLVNEVSKVNTLGKHVLKFTFGSETVFAFNDATNWWNNNWGYRKKITINHSQIPDHLSNFPVLINMTDTDLCDTSKHDGGDIAFISYEDNTTQYAHEIEYFNKTTGRITCWINISKVSSTIDTILWMYYNNSDCTNQQDRVAVWDKNFAAVQHLQETSSTHNDSTSNNNDGTPNGVNQDITGLIDGADEWNQNTDYVSVNTTGMSVSSGTLSLWGKAQSFSDIQYFFGHTTTPAFSDLIQIYINDTDGNLGLGLGDDHVKAENISKLNTNTWYHLVLTWDDSQYTVYVNGSNTSYGSYSGLSTLNESVDIGNNGDSNTRNQALDGSIDEVRISNTNRNQSWIIASYNNIKNQSTFLSFGLEESAAPNVSNPYPLDEDETVPTTPDYFEITVFDPNPDLLNITWKTNYSGSWETFNVTNGTGNGVTDGTYQVTNTSWATTFDQPYFWSVNVTDGLHWTNETFTFTMYQYNPIINSFTLSNETGCKLNNQTGNLDVGKEYIFSINVTDKNGWNDVKYINLSCWFDNGDDNSFYNQTEGGNYNLKLQYENTTGLAQYQMLWPDDESELLIENCSETIFNQTTRIINLSFIPGNQTRCATSNQTWNPVENSLDDLYSWNLNCTITDGSENKDYYENEYGVNWHSTITAPDLVEITGAPGMIEEANEDFPITFTCNSDYELVIYLETNLTQIGGSDIITLKDNLRLLATADETDDVTIDTNFSGAGEHHSITLENTTAPFNDEQRIINTRFELSIPFGTWGTYSARIVKKIYRR